MKKRITSLLLAILMLVTILPTTALAEDIPVSLSGGVLKTNNMDTVLGEGNYPTAIPEAP